MNKRFYNFGAYRLNTLNHRLLREGETVSLTPKEFEVLHTLVKSAGDVVSKDALLEAVWKDVYVNEETLMRNVSWLRKKLGGGENFIETVPKFGYRFAAEVTATDLPDLIIEEQTVQHIRIEETLSLPEVQEEGETGRKGYREKKIAALPDISPSPRFPFSFSPLLAAVFGVLALAAAGFAVYQIFFRQPETKTSIAARVTPFSGVSGRENYPAFSPDGKRLAFVRVAADNTQDLFFTSTNGGEPRQITFDRKTVHSLAWSADGTEIFFVSFRVSN